MKLPNYEANHVQTPNGVRSQVTYAPSFLATSNQDARPTKARIAFVAQNCDTLADLLEHHIPDKHHLQSTWFEASANECGTVGCALGWAARMHIIPGLQHRRHEIMEAAIVPCVNGRVSTWHDAGRAFFGENVWANVFRNGWISKKEVIRRLRRIAEDLRTGRDRLTPVL